MNNYFITYNDDKTVTITALSPEHARNVLKNTIVNVVKINSTVKIPKNAKSSKR